MLARQSATLAFRITDTVKGDPVRGLSPGAWIDMVGVRGETAGSGLPCRERVGMYVSGKVGIRPLIDVNSYLILSLNRDSTISVVDPNVVIGGTSSVLFDQIILPRPGEDWVLGRDRKRLFVSMPRADAVAVIDAERFELEGRVATGSEPMRVALQPDGRFVWIGTNARGNEGGVSVIDTQTLEVVATIPTGRGHHEIAFTDDDRTALVTNRADGTATAIDVQTRKVRKQISAGAQPLAVVYSRSSRAFYVADGAGGRIRVIDARTLKTEAEIDAKRGIGPMRTTEDGRWLLVANPAADEVLVIDASANRIVHTVPVKGKPFQLSVTRAFAYVRALENNALSMINLGFLGKAGQPPVTVVPLGGDAPGKVGRLPLADSLVEAAGEAGVVAANAAEGSLVYYMEGMTAPMSSFRSLGGAPRGVLVVDRFLAESEPGVYSARVQMPAAGRYEAAFVLDTPQIVHCFSFEAEANPALADPRKIGIEFVSGERQAKAGEALPLRFRLYDPATGTGRTGLSDVVVHSYRAPGFDPAVVAATERGDGVYEALLRLPRPGAYYVHVASAAASAPVGELPFISIAAVAAPVSSASAPARSGGERQGGQ